MFVWFALEWPNLARYVTQVVGQRIFKGSATPPSHGNGAPASPKKLAARDLFAVDNLFVRRYFCVFQDELSQQLEIYSWFTQVAFYILWCMYCKRSRKYISHDNVDLFGQA